MTSSAPGTCRAEGTTVAPRPLNATELGVPIRRTRGGSHRCAGDDLRGDFRIAGVARCGQVGAGQPPDSDAQGGHARCELFHGRCASGPPVARQDGARRSRVAVRCFVPPSALRQHPADRFARPCGVRERYPGFSEPRWRTRQADRRARCGDGTGRGGLPPPAAASGKERSGGITQPRGDRSGVHEPRYSGRYRPLPAPALAAGSAPGLAGTRR